MPRGSRRAFPDCRTVLRAVARRSSPLQRIERDRGRPSTGVQGMRRSALPIGKSANAVPFSVDLCRCERRALAGSVSVYAPLCAFVDASGGPVRENPGTPGYRGAVNIVGNPFEVSLGRRLTMPAGAARLLLRGRNASIQALGQPDCVGIQYAFRGLPEPQPMPTSASRSLATIRPSVASVASQRTTRQRRSRSHPQQ